MKNNEGKLVTFLGRLYSSDINLLENKNMVKLISLIEKEEIYNTLRKHKVLQIGIKNIQSLLKDGHNFSSLLEYLNEECSKVPFVHFPEGIISLMNELSEIDGVVFKGAILSGDYPVGYIRDQGDIDILTERTPFDLNIMSEKFEFHKIKMHVNVDDEIYFTADLMPTQSNIPPLDIHSFAYYLWGGMSINLKDIETQEFVSDSLSYAYPIDEFNILFLVAHAVADWTYRMRDINDLYLVLSKGVDYKKVIQLIDNYNFKHFFVMLIKEVDDIYKTHFIHDFKITEVASPLNITSFRKNNFGNFSKRAAFLSSLIITYNFYRKRRNKMYSFIKSLSESINLVAFNNRAFNINRANKKLKSNSIVVLWKNTGSLWMPGGYHERVSNRKDR